MRIGEIELEHDGSSWSARARFREFGDLVGKRTSFELSIPSEDEPSDAQRAGLAWFLAHRAEVADAVRAAIHAAYPEQRRRFGHDVVMPEALNLAHVALRDVTFHRATLGEAPYLGFGFSCTWEDEHGFGLMMHGTRCVEAGGGDTAILGWITDRDAKAGGGSTAAERRAAREPGATAAKRPAAKKVAAERPAAKKVAAKKKIATRKR